MALSDPQRILATPLTIINRRDDKTDIEALLSTVSQHQVERIIVGLPRSLNGSLGEQAQKVQAFTRKLAEQVSVPVEFRDERLSSVSAKRLMQAVPAKKSRQKTPDDAIAAAIILQSYLDEEPLRET